MRWRLRTQGVLIDRTAVPVLSRWDASAKVTRCMSRPRRAFAWTTPRRHWFATAPSGARDAVVAFYQRQRDAGWLDLFLGSLRCVSDAVDVHCVGDFDQEELAILARFRCTAHSMPATEPEIAENVAHFYLQPGARPDRVGRTRHSLIRCWCWTVCVRCFPRDPFLTKTIGLSVFCEGPDTHRRVGVQPRSSGTVRAARRGLAAAPHRVVDGAAGDACRSCVSSTAGCSSSWSTAPSC